MVKRALESKPEFQNIYTAFHQKIRRYLARLVGEADSEDVTQEVFLKVNAGLNDFRETARQVADIVLTELKKTEHWRYNYVTEDPDKQCKSETAKTECS
jgi:hypothetical protein